MITTANYILQVRAEDGETYVFSYDSPSVWTALQEFWHEDYAEYLASLDMNSCWPVDVYAMENGRVVRTHHFKLCTPSFHAFFDKGHTYNGPYTIDQFARDIRRKAYGMTIQMVCDRIAGYTGDCKKEAMRKARLFRHNCCVPLTQVEDIRLSFGRRVRQDGSVCQTLTDPGTLHFRYRDSENLLHSFSIIE